MTYTVRRFKKEKRWICACKRVNDPQDEKCAFCGEPKASKGTNGPKYKSSKQEYNGRWYHSKLEANYAAQLDFMKKAGEIKEWRPQVKLSFKVNGVLICNHYVDFRIITKDGTVQYHETKGYETDSYRMKKKLLLALLPEIDPGAEYIVIK